MGGTARLGVGTRPGPMPALTPCTEQGKTGSACAASMPCRSGVAASPAARVPPGGAFPSPDRAERPGRTDGHRACPRLPEIMPGWFAVAFPRAARVGPGSTATETALGCVTLTPLTETGDRLTETGDHRRGGRGGPAIPAKATGIVSTRGEPVAPDTPASRSLAATPACVTSRLEGFRGYRRADGPDGLRHFLVRHGGRDSQSWESSRSTWKDHGDRRSRFRSTGPAGGRCEPETADRPCRIPRLRHGHPLARAAPRGPATGRTPPAHPGPLR